MPHLFPRECVGGECHCQPRFPSAVDISPNLALDGMVKQFKHAPISQWYYTVIFNLHYIKAVLGLQNRVLAFLVGAAALLTFRILREASDTDEFLM